jgi:hypothetical protein
VVVALLSAFDGPAAMVARWSLEHGLVGALGQNGFELLGLAAFTVMAAVLYRVSRRQLQ